MNNRPNAGFGIYVHWPFCETKCPYCDFNSHTSDQINQIRWLNAYRLEIEAAAERLEDSTKTQPMVTSIFFGGGTPSLMEPDVVDEIIGSISSAFHVHDKVEVSLEANPSSAEASRFSGYAQAGVNRVSIGVQSLSDDSLAFLERIHGRTTALEAIEAARKNFPRYSFDLIYALPKQTVKSWVEELEEAISLTSGHLSVYQLTIETGTPFARKGICAASNNTAEEMFKLTQDILTHAGLPAYEISNHASIGQQCKHNMTYWRGGEYLGIGPGAHSRLKKSNCWQAIYRSHSPSRWLTTVEAHGDGTAKSKDLSIRERLDEVVMMGLRLKSGIQLKDFLDATGLTFELAFDEDRIRALIEAGFIVMESNALRATPEGLLRLNAVIAHLLKD